MRIMITGGAGFTGINLSKRLIDKRNEVIILDRKINEDKKTWFKQKGIEMIVGDVRDKKSIKKAIKNINIIYHLASSFRASSRTDKLLWETDILGTKNLLDASIYENIDRFIHCSTALVLGHISCPPADESYPYNSREPYQKAKCEGEKIVLRYLKKGRLNGVILRPAYIYGPGDTRLFTLFKMINNKTFIMIGKGEVHSHLVFIDDLIDAYELAADREEALGEIFIIGQKESITLNELVKTIAEVLEVPAPRWRFPLIWPVLLAGWGFEAVSKPLGIEPHLIRRRIDFFRKNHSFDISKARRELGYEPKYVFKNGARITADWYKRLGWL